MYFAEWFVVLSRKTSQVGGGGVEACERSLGIIFGLISTALFAPFPPCCADYFSFCIRLDGTTDKKGNSWAASNQML